MLVSMLTPAAIVLAAADLIRHLQGHGAAVTGCSMNPGGAGPQVTATVMRQVGKRAVSKRETADTHNAAMLAALR